jgi:hypothetical protein
MPSKTLIPDPAVIAVERIVPTDAEIVLAARTRRCTLPCPVCGRPATRVHSWYTRSLRDLPWEASLGDRLSRKEKGPYFPALADTHCKKEAPMELMIPLPLILPDTPLSLDQLEEAVHLWGLAIQQHARARVAGTSRAASSGCVPRVSRRLAAAGGQSPAHGRDPLRRGAMTAGAGALPGMRTAFPAR